VYLFGGEVGDVGVGKVARAPLTFEGTLGGFVDEIAALTSTKDGVMVAQIGDFVHVLGGRANASVFRNEIDSAQIPNTATLGTFGPGGSLTTARAFGGIAMIGDNLYVLGGNNTGGNLTTVDTLLVPQDGRLGVTLDLAQNGAGQNLTVASAGRRGQCTVVIRDKLYQIGGGIGPSDAPTGQIDRCQIKTKQLVDDCTPVAGITLPTARKDVHCAVIGNSLLVIGSDQTGTNGGIIVEQSQIDPNTGDLGPFSPQSMLTLNMGRKNHVLTHAGNSLFVIGGEAIGGLNSMSIERMDTR
jgi:hypothetical protein